MNRWLTMKRRKPRRNLHKSSRKRQKSTTLDMVVDRISDLPDPILSIVLSFLPTTRNAIATSTLSKRWRFMWKTVHNLVFFHLGRREGDDMRFIEFVNRVLLLHDATLLNKFLLFWKPSCNLVHLRSWIKTVITRNVHELAIGVETRVGPDSRPKPIKMPISVFNCESLRYLELDSGIYFSEADVIFLPRLEGLELIKVDFESEMVFEKLISGCPVLNFLHLEVDFDYMLNYFGKNYGDFTYRISSTSVKHLELCFCYNLEEPREDNFYCSLALETPSLEYLGLGGFLYEINVQKCLSSMVEAEFKIELHDIDFSDPSICDSIVEVVRAFDCAKILTLSNDAMMALSQAEISLSTEFKRLVKLEMAIACCHCCVSLRDFIHCSDNLEVLTIIQYPRGDFHVNHSDWKAPAEVPTCLTNSLKKVVFDVYCGNADEREMIRYMLKHGSALELMQLKCERDTAKFELLQEICKFPRKSPVCEVEFIVVDQSIPDRVVTSPNSHSVLGSN